nr:MAG TPA: hypothetical protein [Caudoviricetes sp.]
MLLSIPSTIFICIKLSFVFYSLRWYLSTFSILTSFPIKIAFTGILLPVRLQFLHSLFKCFSIHNLSITSFHLYLFCHLISLFHKP